MISKRFVLCVLTLCLTAGVTYSVWSHCHNTESCENLTSHLVSGYKWSQPNDNRVDYKDILAALNELRQRIR